MKFSDCQFEYARESFPIAGTFRISRGAKTEAEVVICRIKSGRHYGHGECVPYAHYGESIESVLESLADATSKLTGEFDSEDIMEILPAGAARNALDCALWDLRAKSSGVHAHRLACKLPPRPVETAFTISLGEPDEMANNARSAAQRPLLKIKLGGTADHDIAALHAVASSAPNSRLIVDANEGWAEEDLSQLMLEAARLRVALVEQPLPAGNDDLLAEIPHPVPICADESVHTAGDLDTLRAKYDAINIKLDKTGGLTEALRMRDHARALGFGVMVGCMVGSSLSMAPAVLLAQDADYVDLDGPLLLAKDRSPSLRYAGNVISPPDPELWG